MFFKNLFCIDKLKARGNIYSSSMTPTVPWHRNTSSQAPASASRRQGQPGTQGRAPSQGWGRMDPKQVVWMQHRVCFALLQVA